jgi:hypothetical protein
VVEGAEVPPLVVVCAGVLVVGVVEVVVVGAVLLVLVVGVLVWATVGELATDTVLVWEPQPPSITPPEIARQRAAAVPSWFVGLIAPMVFGGARTPPRLGISRPGVRRNGFF